MAGELRAYFDRLAHEAADAGRAILGTQLQGAVLYGSVARGTPNPNSDIDILLIVEGLPSGRGPRSRLADEVAERFSSGRPGLPSLSLVLRTPQEVSEGFPLLLDITEEGMVLFDRDDCASRLLQSWRDRLVRSGAKRIQTGETWHWDLAGTSTDGNWRL